jgi:hypothetical protein
VAASQTAGGTVDIEGTLNALGDTIDLGATSAFANTTLGGTLENAVIVSDGGTITYNLGTLVSSTVEGTLDLGDSGLLLVAGGLTVTGASGTGPGVIDVTGAGAATLVLTDSEVLDNVTLNVGSDVGFDGVNGNGATLVFGPAAVVNSLGINGLQLGGAAAVTNAGTINAGVADGVASIDTGVFTNTGTINVTNAQVMSIVSESGTFTNTGLVDANGGTIDIGSAVSGAGSIDVGKLGLVVFAGAVASGQTVAMTSTNSEVVLDLPSSFAGTVAGFQSSDRIDLVGVATVGTGVSAVGATAVVTSGGSSVTLDVGKLASGYGYALDSDGNGGSNLFTGKVFNGPASGYGTFAPGAQNAIINAQGYGNKITVTGRDSLINTGTGGANVSIANGNAKVDLAGYHNVVTSTGPGAEVVVGAASDSTVTLADANDDVSLTGSGNTVNAGGGNNTVVLAGNDDTVSVTWGQQAISVIGTSDLVSLLASASGSIRLAGLNDTVFLGSGTPTITDAGSGLNVFVGKGTGQSIVTGVASDPHFVIDLVGGVGGFTSAAKAYASLTSDGHGGSLLSLGGNSSIDIAGVTPNHLSAHNFALVSSFHV